MNELLTNLENIRSSDPYKKFRAIQQLKNVADIFEPARIKSQLLPFFYEFWNEDE